MGVAPEAPIIVPVFAEPLAELNRMPLAPFPNLVPDGFVPT